MLLTNRQQVGNFLIYGEVTGKCVLMDFGHYPAKLVSMQHSAKINNEADIKERLGPINYETHVEQIRIKNSNKHK